MKKVFLLLAFSAGSVCYGQFWPNLHHAPLLVISPDARSAAMGNAGAATSPDNYSIYWNMAKQSFNKERMGYSLSYTPWYRALVPDCNLYYASGFYNIDDKNALAASFRYFSMPEITFMNIIGIPVFNFKPYQYAADLGYSRKVFDNGSLGITAKYVYSNSFGSYGNYHPASSLAADVSYYGFAETGRNFIAWGVNIANIGPKLVYNELESGGFLPANLKIGGSIEHAFNEDHQLELALDLNKLLVPSLPKYKTDTAGYVIFGPDGPVIEKGMDPSRPVSNAIFTSFYDAPNGFKEELQEVMMNAGMEYTFRDVFAARAGYSYAHENKGYSYVTIGAGGRYKSFGLDVAYLFPTINRSPLENTYRVSLNVMFGKKTEKNADPS